MHVKKTNSEGHPQYAHAQPVSDSPASFAAAGEGVVKLSSIIVGPCMLIDLEVFLWLRIFIANFTTAADGMYYHFDF